MTLNRAIYAGVLFLGYGLLLTFCAVVGSAFIGGVTVAFWWFVIDRMAWLFSISRESLIERFEFWRISVWGVAGLFSTTLIIAWVGAFGMTAKHLRHGRGKPGRVEHVAEFILDTISRRKPPTGAPPVHEGGQADGSSSTHTQRKAG